MFIHDLVDITLIINTLLGFNVQNANSRGARKEEVGLGVSVEGLLIRAANGVTNL